MLRRLGVFSGLAILLLATTISGETPAAKVIAVPVPETAVAGPRKRAPFDIAARAARSKAKYRKAQADQAAKQDVEIVKDSEFEEEEEEEDLVAAGWMRPPDARAQMKPTSMINSVEQMLGLTDDDMGSMDSILLVGLAEDHPASIRIKEVTIKMKDGL
jgi:hypothetical protein